MYKIIKKENISDSVKRIIVEAPSVAFNAKAGQFVMVTVDENGERVPLTLSDIDKTKGLITLIFQEVGYSTKKLGDLKEGESIFSVLGPLGKPTELGKYGRVVCIGGGVGIAEVYPVSKALKEKGNNVIGIIGARSKQLLILEDQMREVCNELFITTDDGSYGRKGFVTEILKEVLEKLIYPTLPRGEFSKGFPIRKYGEENIVVYAIGPVPMMAKVAEATKPYNIKTIVSLNPIMVDATGMCGSCRVTVGGQTKFGCIDGPEFDAHEVDFKELMERLSFFKNEEECLNKMCPKR